MVSVDISSIFPCACWPSGHLLGRSVGSLGFSECSCLSPVGSVCWLEAPAPGGRAAPCSRVGLPGVVPGRALGWVWRAPREGPPPQQGCAAVCTDPPDSEPSATVLSWGSRRALLGDRTDSTLAVTRETRSLQPRGPGELIFQRGYCRALPGWGPSGKRLKLPRTLTPPRTSAATGLPGPCRVRSAGHSPIPPWLLWLLSLELLALAWASGLGGGGGVGSGVPAVSLRPQCCHPPVRGC